MKYLFTLLILLLGGSLVAQTPQGLGEYEDIHYNKIKLSIINGETVIDLAPNSNVGVKIYLPMADTAQYEGGVQFMIQKLQVTKIEVGQPEYTFIDNDPSNYDWIMLNTIPLSHKGEMLFIHRIVISRYGQLYIYQRFTD